MGYITLAQTLVCIGLTFFFLFFSTDFNAIFYTLCADGLHYIESVLICGARNEGFTASIEPARNNMKHYWCIF